MSFVPRFESLGGGAHPERTVLFLHGIFGAGRNWRSFARRLAARRPGWRLLLADLRNHGASQDAPPPHGLAACAKDLEHLFHEAGGPPQAVYAHSFSGKVALTHAARSPAALEELWLLDSPPGPPLAPARIAGSEVERVFAAMRSLPQPLAERAALEPHFAAAGIPRAVSAWMATNLVQRPDGFRWRFDLGALREMLDDYYATDGLPLASSLAPAIRLHLVRAALSPRYAPEELAAASALEQDGRARLHVLDAADHWLHVSNPDGLLALLLDPQA